MIHDSPGLPVLPKGKTPQSLFPSHWIHPGYTSSRVHRQLDLKSAIAPPLLPQLILTEFPN
ncbi:hypothetical protein [Oscillatoria sp. HE19RPO]|uniref:hypothetical protein n=1 Tax=Oscillatoria sp. HE19RPO TaxID=2954806 RepID=UPI0020C4870A|nr:hypothetical protein [Oscillatoria sp. HE19RPO]